MLNASDGGKARRLARFFSKSQAINPALKKVATIGTLAIRNETPQKSKALVRSQRLRQSGKLEYTLTEGLRYGGILREGSPSHEIKPRTKKALYWPGLSHPISMVPEHPGIKRRNYVMIGLQNARSDMKIAAKEGTTTIFVGMPR